MPPVDRNKPKRAASSESALSMMEFMREFPDDKTCLEYLWRTRYAPDGNTTHCPSCDRERRFHRVKDRPTYDCDTCGHHLHPTAGTIFHKSSTSLQLWFYAIWLLTSTRCGISAKQLERELGVTYKTAWRMFNKIRNDLMAQDYAAPLGGAVEADEAGVGGKPRGSHVPKMRAEGVNPDSRSESMTWHAARKATIFGMVERDGKVIAKVIPSRYGYTLRSTLAANLRDDAIVYTDEYGGYSGIERRWQHYRIHHSRKVYALGHVHTQTIEGFFGSVQNAIRGVYHGVSHKWLQGYLNEWAWRYNHRDDRDAMFRLLLHRAATTP